MSGIRSLTRRPSQPGFATAASAPIRVDDTSGQVSLINAGSGTTEVAILAAYKPSAAITAATHTPGAKDSGLILYYSAVAGIVVTLPAATGSGNRYKYVRSVRSTSVGDVFQVASASDWMRGWGAIVAKDDGLYTQYGTINTQTSTTESDTVTFPFSTTGPDVGDWAEFIDIAPNVWHVQTFNCINATEASPFSAAV